MAELGKEESHEVFLIMVAYIYRLDDGSEVYTGN